MMEVNYFLIMFRLVFPYYYLPRLCFLYLERLLRVVWLLILIYLILLLLAIIYYLRKCLDLNYFSILLFCFIFYATPELFIFGFGLYGEIPALFFIILSILFLHKYDYSNKNIHLLIVGTALGLAFLTKTVSLIVLPAYLIYFFISFLQKWKKKIKPLLVNFLLFLFGYILPVIIFEIYRFLLLGNLDRYRLWWSSQFHSILMQAGLEKGFEDSPGIITKVITHLEILANSLNISQIFQIIIFTLFFSFFIFVILFNIKKQFFSSFIGLFEQKSILVLSIITLSYFGWWLILTPTQKAWYRRIFNGIILFEICLIIMLVFIAFLINKYIQNKKILEFNFSIILQRFFSFLVSLVLFFNLVFSKNYQISFEPTSSKVNYNEVTSYINKLPDDSVFFGFDWMQAPIVSFAAKKEFKNISFDSEINNPGMKENKYFVIDRDAKKVAQEDYMKILRVFNSQLRFTNTEVNIYKLNNRYALIYDDFNENERNDVSAGYIDFSKDSVNGYTRNVYINELGQPGKWAQKYSGYLLKYSGEKFLEIQFWVPELKNYGIEQPKLEVYINNKYIGTYAVEEAGFHNYSIPIKDISSENSWEISLFFNSRVIAKNDMRELAFMIIELALRK